MPLHDLLGTGDHTEPGPDPLRAIVVRARRRHRRVAAGGVAVALVVGGAIGFAISNHSSPTTQTSTAPATQTSTGPAASGAAAATSGATPSGSSGGAMTAGPIELPGVSGHLTPLFTRTSNTGVDLRVFRTAAITPAALPAGCEISLPRIQVDVSTTRMVGITFGSAPTTHSRPLTAVTSDVVGQPEGDPTAVIEVATGPTVTRVQMVFTGGKKDSTPTSDGWAVLAASVPAHLASGASLGSLTAMDAAGHPMGSSAVTLTGYQPFGVPAGNCGLPCPQPGASITPTSAATTRSPVRCAALACGAVVSPGVPPAVRTLPALRAAGAPVCLSGGASGSSGSGSSGSGSSGAASSGTGSSGAGILQHRFGHEQRCRGVTRARQCHHVGSAASLATIPERGGPERGGRRPLDQHRLRRVLSDPLPPPASGLAAERGGPGHRRGRGPGGVRPGVRPLAPGVPRPKSARLHLHHGLPPVATAPTPQGSRAWPFQCRPPPSQWR